MLKLVAAVLCLLVVTVQTSPSQSRSSMNDMPAIIAIEEPCVRQGGLCQRIDDCDPANVVKVHVHLCPKQSHLGAICCYF